MRGWFFTNTIWYLLLFAASAAIFAVAVKKSGNRKFTVGFTLATIGLFYIFEYVLVMTDAYAYLPKIFPKDSFLDTYMGNVFSQTSIAAVSMLIIVYRLKWYWLFGFAVAYYLIELLFISLGIYDVYWYKSIYTPFILVPLFFLLRKWHDKALNFNRVIDGMLMHFLGALAVATNTVSFPLRLLNLFVLSGRFFPDPSKDHTATGLIFIISTLGMLVLAWRSERRRLWVPVALVSVFFIDYASWKAGLIVSPEHWFVPVSLLRISVTYMWVCIIGNCVQARFKRLPSVAQ